MSSCTVINAHITDQVIQLSNLPRIASGLVGALQIRCNFCGKWDGCGKVAVFYRTEDEVYHVPVESGLVTVPPEVLADEGHFFMGFAGVDDLTRTTEVIRVEVAKGAITTATAVSDPTPDIYQQLIAAYGSAMASFSSRFDELDARFNTAIAVPGSFDEGSDLDITSEDGLVRARIKNNGYTAWASFTVDGNGVSEVTSPESPTYTTEILIPPQYAPLGSVVIEDWRYPNLMLGLMEDYSTGGFKVYVIGAPLATFAVSTTYGLASPSLLELADARVGFDNTTYDTAGDAVREQVFALHNRCGYIDGRVNGVAADLEDLKENGLGDPIILESDGEGTIKIAKAKPSDEPDEPDTPVEPDEPDEPELDPHTLSGTIVTIDNAEAVGLPLEISAGADATKVFVGGKNWWPDGDLEFTKHKSNQPLPMMYPAGVYRCKADVTLSEGATDTFCLLQLKNLDTAKTTSARLRLDGKEWVATVSHPFAHYSIFAAEAANIPNTAQIKNIVLQYETGCEWEPYRGVVRDLPVSGLTVESTPSYVFTDGSDDVQVTYYTPAPIEEPDEPAEPDEPIDPEYTYIGEAKTLIFDNELYDSFRDKKAQKGVDELGKRVVTLEKLAEQGGGAGGGTSVITPPDYYLTNNYLPNKVSTINALMQSTAANGDAFIFITDQHTEQNKNAGQTPSLLRYISNNTKVRRLFSGGDVGLTQAQQVAYHEQMEHAFDGDVHYVMGNHEYDRLRATDADLYYIHDINKPNQIGNSARHYYYVDNPQQKMRYVVVNNWESKGATADGGKASDLDAQAAWLTGTAFNVETGWGIILFCHQFFNDPGASAPSGTADAFMDAIDGYTGAGEILAVFHGHIHADMVNHTTTGVPVIGVTADKTDISMETKPICTQVNRTVGTITEQAFDVVIVDRAARKLHCVRIGAPAVDGNGALGNEQVEIRVVDFKTQG